MMLIVALRKLTSKQKQNIKEHYKTLVFDKRLHLRKSIDKLICEVLIVELDLSRVFSVSKNVVYKWLKEQNIIDITTAFIYESTKYKKLFDKHVNFFVRSFPELFKKNIEETIKDKELKDETVKSKYEAPTEEEEEQEVKITGLEHVQKQIDDVIERLKKLENKEDPCNTPVNKDHMSETKKEPIKKVWTIKQSTKKYIVQCNDENIKEFFYRNGIEKRKAKHQAEKYLATCK